MHLGFVNNCRYFLISQNDSEGAYRKAFLVCKSGGYSSSQMDGLRRWAEGCQREMGCSEICLTPATTQPPSPPPSRRRLFLCSLAYRTNCLCWPYFLFQIPPNKICPTIVLQLFSVCAETYCPPPTHPATPHPPPPRSSAHGFRFLKQISGLSLSSPSGHVQVSPILQPTEWPVCSEYKGLCNLCHELLFNHPEGGKFCWCCRRLARSSKFPFLH